MDGLIDKISGEGGGGGYQHDVLDVFKGHGGVSGGDAIGGDGEGCRNSF